MLIPQWYARRGPDPVDLGGQGLVARGPSCPCSTAARPSTSPTPGPPLTERVITVIEDAAHAFGSHAGDRRVGATGQLTGFSLGPIEDWVRPTDEAAQRGAREPCCTGHDGASWDTGKSGLSDPYDESGDQDTAFGR
ncbi:DegT/DnrJ/EryC1/StrS family aminotransferase [Streptomyces sp. NPDC091371]|uniref:DegT/DnrJ/EryC1/StrS family aminotransferase n=1 Tax=Streptomyces sp. NPDC091371 TaxID=3155303 RepID=UPI003412960E